MFSGTVISKSVITVETGIDEMPKDQMFAVKLLVEDTFRGALGGNDVEIVTARAKPLAVTTLKRERNIWLDLFTRTTKRDVRKINSIGTKRSVKVRTGAQRPISSYIVRVVG